MRRLYPPEAELMTHVIPFDHALAFIVRLVGERPKFRQIVFKAED